MKKSPPPKKFSAEERATQTRANREAINPPGLATALGAGIYRGSPAEREDRAATPSPGQWAIKNGLRNGELAILQRALAMYHKEYLLLKNLSPNPAEKGRMQDYIDASDALARRLRYELQREPA